MRIQSKYLDEKLTAADPTSKWISDFVASDNPRFADKSKKERINMALGASYAAKGQSNNEETYSDTGWTKSRERKDPQGNVIKTKNVASKLAKQGMQQAKAKARTSSEKGFGPSPADKLSIRKEDVELDEMDKSQPSSSRGAEGLPLGKKADPAKTDKVKSDALKVLQKQYKKVKEEVELGEELTPMQNTHFSLMNKHRVAAQFAKGSEKDKHRMAALDHERALRNHDSQSHSSSMTSSKKLGVTEEEELDELDQTTLTKYATRAKFSSDPKRREGAAKAQEKINKKSKDMQKEEAEQVNELSKDTLKSYAGKVIDKTRTMPQGEKKQKHLAGLTKAMDRMKEEVSTHPDVKFQKDMKAKEEARLDALKAYDARKKYEKMREGIGLDERIAAASVAGASQVVSRPAASVAGASQVAGRLAGAGAIKDQVRKFANRLKKKITGKNEEVEFDEDNKAYRSQDKASRETTGMSLPQRSKMYDDIQKKLKDQEEEYRKQGILPPKNEEVDLEEAGKLQGGGKDPCWTGYKMVGMKKKGGREVPNCVPREGKEYKSFKALREELNGNSNRS